MKNLLLIIAALLVLAWGVLFWGFQASGPLHLLPEIAGVLVLVRMVFN